MLELGGREGRRTRVGVQAGFDGRDEAKQTPATWVSTRASANTQDTKAQSSGGHRRTEKEGKKEGNDSQERPHRQEPAEKKSERPAKRLRGTPQGPAGPAQPQGEASHSWATAPPHRPPRA